MDKILRESVIARLREAESRIYRLSVQHRVVGLGCGLVLDQDLVWSKGFGLSDLEDSKSLPDENTIFRCGSITKTFTAAAIARLCDQRKLSLDDPLSRYVPEFQAVKMNRGALEEVTLRRLLAHRSGNDVRSSA
jgi:CubicO group peptidase (beta-lactamase class C family)